MPVDVKIDDGIVIAECCKNIQLDLNTARKIVEERLRLQNGKTLPIIIHMNGLISNSKSVRMFMANEGAEGISLGAFVVQKRYEEILVNLFLTIDDPKVPTRIFKTQGEAIAWIKEIQQTLNAKTIG